VAGAIQTEEFRPIFSSQFDEKFRGIQNVQELYTQFITRLFENRVPRRIFGPKRDEVTGDCRKLHNEELHNSSPNIIRMIKSRKMKWAGHVALIGRRGMHIGYWWGSQKERDH
jgi:hypothetical protein